MNAQNAAKEKLFGEAGLRASNFKLFPGSSRDATAEQVAQEVVNSITRLEAGEIEVVENFED